MSVRRYIGKLFFGSSSDHLDVQAFIVREHEIAFSFASVSSEYRRWQAESGTVAKRREDGSFLAERINAKQDGVDLALPWRLVFKIANESPGESVEIEGELIQSGVPYPFAGELEAAMQ